MIIAKVDRALIADVMLLSWQPVSKCSLKSSTISGFIAHVTHLSNQVAFNQMAINKHNLGIFRAQVLFALTVMGTWRPQGTSVHIAQRAVGGGSIGAKQQTFIPETSNRLIWPL